MPNIKLKEPRESKLEFEDRLFTVRQSPFGKHNTNERCYDFDIRSYSGSAQAKLTATELVEMADWILQTFGANS